MGVNAYAEIIVGFVVYDEDFFETCTVEIEIQCTRCKKTDQLDGAKFCSHCGGKLIHEKDEYVLKEWYKEWAKEQPYNLSQEDLLDWGETISNNMILTHEGHAVFGVKMASVECLRGCEELDIEQRDITAAFKEVKELRKRVGSKSHITMYVKGNCG